MKLDVLAPSALLAASMALATPSQAASVTRSELTLSASACQAALPAFDGLIRKRPMALQNEGTQTAFVTCGYEGAFGAVPTSSYLAVLFNNTTGTPQTVNCTLVDGQNTFSNPVYFPKSVTVAANTTTGVIDWSSGDNGGAKFIYPAASCSLPPGVGVISIGRQYLEDVGM